MPQYPLRSSGLQRAVLVCALALSALAPRARAQLIPVKTVRVAEADLAGYQPSSNAGMGTLLTIPDTLLDPYNNPATGARLRRSRVVGSLMAHAVSHDGGTGRTLPLGVLGSRGPWFGGFAYAGQNVSPARSFNSGPDQQSGKNRHVSAFLGRTLGRTSVGASAAWSSLPALDGADLLYPAMTSMKRVGHSLDLRLGAVHGRSGGASVEAVLLKTRSSSAHEVAFLDRVWNPNTQTTNSTSRIVSDHDRVETVGMHLVASRPVVDSTWRVGVALTGNRIEHTAMPTMGAMSIRHDPGRSDAFNAVVGFSRAGKVLRFGMDAIYEPIWSRVSLTGSPNDDRYRFTNTVFRGGVSTDFTPKGTESSLRLLLGAQVRSIRYDRERVDSAQNTTMFHSAWNEWAHNAGVSFLDKLLELHLQWRVQSGARRPGSNNQTGFFSFGSPAVFGAPQGALVPARASTLQVTLVVPVR